MSSYHFRDWLHELEHNERPTHQINQQYGHVISPNDFLMPLLAPLYPELAHAAQIQATSSRPTSSLGLQHPSAHHEHQQEHYLHRLHHHPTYADLRHMYRPWHLQRSEHDDDDDDIVHDKDSFVVNLDVQHFSPNEITVKVVDDAIVAEGKHEEKADAHGYISRQFTRRYVIPETHDINKVRSHLSTDGVLTLAAPKIGEKEAESKQRTIPVIPTGPLKHIKENNDEKKQ